MPKINTSKLFNQSLVEPADKIIERQADNLNGKSKLLVEANARDSGKLIAEADKIIEKQVADMKRGIKLLAEVTVIEDEIPFGKEDVFEWKQIDNLKKQAKLLSENIAIGSEMLFNKDDNELIDKMIDQALEEDGEIDFGMLIDIARDNETQFSLSKMLSDENSTPKQDERLDNFKGKSKLIVANNPREENLKNNIGENEQLNNLANKAKITAKIDNQRLSSNDQAIKRIAETPTDILKNEIGLNIKKIKLTDNTSKKRTKYSIELVDKKEAVTPRLLELYSKKEYMNFRELSQEYGLDKRTIQSLAIEFGCYKLAQDFTIEDKKVIIEKKNKLRETTNFSSQYSDKIIAGEYHTGLLVIKDIYKEQYGKTSGSNLAAFNKISRNSANSSNNLPKNRKMLKRDDRG